MSDFYQKAMGVRSISDFQKLQQEFEMKKMAALADAQKAASGGNLPAAIQIADEYGRARAAGDTQRMNDLAIAAKSFDRGVIYDQAGNPVAMGGYGDAVGQIAGTRKAYEAQAQNASDLAYDPLIAGGEAAARLGQELQYAGPIRGSEKTAELTSAQIADVEKKATNAQSQIGLTDQARQILQGIPDAEGKATKSRPTGSFVGAGVNLLKRGVGRSDEKTQANTALEIIAGNLTGNVPRFEGPQSDADRVYYMQMAGRVDDVTRPAEDRLAALDEMDRIAAKYAHIQTPAGRMTNNPAMTTPYDQIQPNPYARAEQEFDNKKKPRLKYNPTTGEFE